MKLPLLLLLIYFSSHLNFNLDKGIKHQQWAMGEGRQKAQEDPEMGLVRKQFSLIL